MKDTAKIIDVLNDLIEINNDRIKGYEKAADEIDSDEVILKTLFYQLSEESRENKVRLVEDVKLLGEDTNDEHTSQRGKIYKRWIDGRIAFSGHDTHSTLSLCELSEDAIQRAYHDAIEESLDFPSSVQQLIRTQLDLLNISHNLIKSQRDHQKNVVHHLYVKTNFHTDI